MLVGRPAGDTPSEEGAAPAAFGLWGEKEVREEWGKRKLRNWFVSAGSPQAWQAGAGGCRSRAFLVRRHESARRKHCGLRTLPQDRIAELRAACYLPSFPKQTQLLSPSSALDQQFNAKALLL